MYCKGVSQIGSWIQTTAKLQKLRLKYIAFIKYMSKNWQCTECKQIPFCKLITSNWAQRDMSN